MRNRRGMTLPEVLIAMTVMALALIPLLAGFQSSSRVERDSDRILRASDLARLAIERAKAISYGDLASTGKARFSKTEDPSQQYEFSRTVVTLPDDDKSPSYKQVTIRVYPIGDRSPLVTLDTYLVPGGV